MNLKDKIDQKIFHLVGEAADAVGQPCYIVGGYVRDIFCTVRRTILTS